MKTTFLVLQLAFAVLFSSRAVAQTINNSQNFALTNVTIHIGNGQTIEKGAIGVKNGKIALVTEDISKITAAEYAQIIDGQQQHVYPGFIAPNTQLGLVEVESVRATQDFREVGHYNPNIRALIAYNTDSQILPTVRSNGVLLAQSVPQGGRISGQSSMMQLEGFNWEEAVLAADNGVHLWFPNRFHYTGWWAEPGRTQGNKNYAMDTRAIKVYMEEALAYSKKETTEAKNLKFEVMKEVLARKKKLFVHVDEAKSTIDAIDLLKSYNVDMVIVGGSEAHLITDVLKQNNIPVIYMNTHELPNNADWDTDQMFKIPAQLQQAGVKFCLGMPSSWQTRNLPFLAGNTVPYGLTKEQALSAITLWTADILGIADRVGSLEVGKDATFVVSKGDALDMRTSIVTDAYIKGKKCDLNNKQKDLYKKYMEKYGF